MPSLTQYLQQAFSDVCPSGWSCRREAHLLPRELERFLGYTSRADLLVERSDGSQRLWVEFEVSRADPVANHAKFATAHLFRPWEISDAFVSMVSPHVARGRRNLAANTIALMRHIGMRAFQTLLFPQLDGATVRLLNHMEMAALAERGLDVRQELDRVFAVAEPVVDEGGHRFHLAGNLLEVMLNLRQWRLDMADAMGRAQWGRRTVTYFVCDRRTRGFAPSKFCAFLCVDGSRFSQMDMGQYVTYDESEPRFDGHVARMHLVRRLAMRETTAGDAPEIGRMFQRWLEGYADAITVHPRGPVFLMPPAWF